MKEFEFCVSGRDAAVAAATKVWTVLGLNNNKAFHCEVEEDISLPPYGNTSWEVDELFVLMDIDEAYWYDSVWTRKSDGEFAQIVIKDGKCFVTRVTLPDTSKLFKIFSVDFEW